MSLMNRIQTLEMLIEEADANLVEWLSGKTDEELMESMTRLAKEYEIAVALEKDATYEANSINTAKAMLELRALMSLLDKLDISAKATTDNKNEGFTLT